MEEPNPNGMCMCGCGQPAPIAKQGNSRAGHVAGKPTRYVHGHHRRGVKHSEESRRKLSESISRHFAENGSHWLGRKHSSETIARMQESQPHGPEHWNWQGGRRTLNGYAAVYEPDNPMAQPSSGYVLEHRLVMSQHLGRVLLPTEDVHHINGDVLDNRIENLQVIDHGKHSSAQRRRLHGAAIRGLFAEGLSVGEVAEYLHMSPQTVRRYQGDPS